MSEPASARARIRDEVTDLLRGGMLGIHGVKKVLRARTWPLQEEDLPAILVYGWQEKKEAIGASTSGMAYRVNLILAVEIRVLDRSRDGEEVEVELENLTGQVCEIVMKARSLLLPRDGLIERIDEVKTTLGINTADSDLALGRALVAFDMKFTEVYEIPPVIDCDEPAIAWGLIQPTAAE